MNQDGVREDPEDFTVALRRRLRGAAADLRHVLDAVPPTGDVAETENPAAARARNAGLSALFKTSANLAACVDQSARAIGPDAKDVAEPTE
jgi:hypothetical protein